jgi:hypothetical protein
MDPSAEELIKYESRPRVFLSEFLIYIASLAMSRSIVQGILATVNRIKKLKMWPRPNKGL